MSFICNTKRWIDRRLGLEQGDKDVKKIKDNAQKRVNEVTKTVKKAGELQKLVIQKTTTYYLGKATGSIR